MVVSIRPANSTRDYSTTELILFSSISNVTVTFKVTVTFGYPRFFNHFNNLSVDQQLITSSFNAPARLAMATP